VSRLLERRRPRSSRPPSRRRRLGRPAPGTCRPARTRPVPRSPVSRLLERRRPRSSRPPPRRRRLERPALGTCRPARTRPVPRNPVSRLLERRRPRECRRPWKHHPRLGRPVTQLTREYPLRTPDRGAKTSAPRSARRATRTA
jgi:hypothetical protein